LKLFWRIGGRAAAQYVPTYLALAQPSGHLPERLASVVCCHVRDGLIQDPLAELHEQRVDRFSGLSPVTEKLALGGAFEQVFFEVDFRRRNVREAVEQGEGVVFQLPLVRSERLRLGLLLLLRRGDPVRSGQGGAPA